VVALTKLHSHFYQPSQTEAQVRGVIEDMLQDMANLSAYEVEDACAKYRRNGANRFFPTPGQLIDATKSKFDDVPRRLQPFNPKEFEARGAHHGPLKPIGQILREHGFERAAGKWDARAYLSESQQ